MSETGKYDMLSYFGLLGLLVLPSHANCEFNFSTNKKKKSEEIEESVEQAEQVERLKKTSSRKPT